VIIFDEYEDEDDDVVDVVAAGVVIEVVDFVVRWLLGLAFFAVDADADAVLARILTRRGGSTTRLWTTSYSSLSLSEESSENADRDIVRRLLSWRQLLLLLLLPLIFCKSNNSDWQPSLLVDRDRGEKIEWHCCLLWREDNCTGDEDVSTWNDMAASFVVIITAAAARIHGVVEREGGGITVILYSIEMHCAAATRTDTSWVYCFCPLRSMNI
jgi:hypothetical protein